MLGKDFQNIDWQSLRGTQHYFQGVIMKKLNEIDFKMLLI